MELQVTSEQLSSLSTTTRQTTTLRTIRNHKELDKEISLKGRSLQVAVGGVSAVTQSTNTP